MFRILILDLGETLVHGGRVFPHVREALTVLRDFETGDGEPLTMCLVSDFTMPTPPVTPQKIAVIFQEYLSLLEGLGLAEFFDPPEERITLSTHAGVQKPGRHIFELAVKRLGLDATLEECIFVTENAQHLAACRAMGMGTLQFGTDFTDWLEGPLLIARMVTPDSEVNLQLALQPYLAVRHQAELVSIEGKPQDGVVRAKVKKWAELADAKLSVLNGVHVTLPVNMDIRLDERGRVVSLNAGSPSAEQIAEARSFVQSLLAHGQVAVGAGPMPSRATHQVEVDPEGRRLLKRARFSAVKLN